MPRNTSGGSTRWKAEFDAAASCKHSGLAYRCGHRACNPGGPFDAVTASGRTIKSVVEEFVGDGRIGEIELAEHIQGGVRWKKITDLAKFAGTIAGLGVAVIGGVLVLRLVSRKNTPAGDGK